jgi:hypothetical protein
VTKNENFGRIHSVNTGARLFINTIRKENPAANHRNCTFGILNQKYFEDIFYCIGLFYYRPFTIMVYMAVGQKGNKTGSGHVGYVFGCGGHEYDNLSPFR